MELRYYQKDAIKAVQASLKQGLNPVVEIPTGGGKSIVIAKLAEWVTSYDNCRVLIVAHRKELLKQNASRINSDVGIYSAGLKEYSCKNKVVVGGIQSIYNKNLDSFKLIIVDECHLIPPDEDSMYQQLFNKYKGVQIVGLSATPYRTDGKLSVFNHNCYSIGYQELIEKGYLSNLVSKVPKLDIEFGDLPLVAGDFQKKALTNRMLDPDTIVQALNYIKVNIINRKKCLVFTVDTEHAEEFSNLLNYNDISSVALHSKLHNNIRDAYIQKFKNGKVRALVNCNILTTGFDDPEIDMIVMLRPTMSKSLYVQMVGRGLRIAEGKKDCLVLDFGGNIARHGTITNLVPHTIKPKAEGQAEGYTHKVCPMCETVVPVRASQCMDCGYEFTVTRMINHDGEPADIDIMGDGGYWAEVLDVVYARHKKEGSPDSLKVTYLLGTHEISEWVCIEHAGFARKKALKWLKARLSFMPELLNVEWLLDNSELIQQPEQVRVVRQGRYDAIKGYKFKTT